MFPYKTLNQYRVSSIYNAVAEITPKGFEGEEEKYLKQQLQAGVVVPSTSQWASMLLLVRLSEIKQCYCDGRLSSSTHRYLS